MKSYTGPCRCDLRLGRRQKDSGRKRTRGERGMENRERGGTEREKGRNGAGGRESQTGLFEKRYRVTSMDLPYFPSFSFCFFLLDIVLFFFPLLLPVVFPLSSSPSSSLFLFRAPDRCSLSTTCSVVRLGCLAVNTSRGLHGLSRRIWPANFFPENG